jgi:hypothetical protein
LLAAFALSRCLIPTALLQLPWLALAGLALLLCGTGLLRLAAVRLLALLWLCLPLLQAGLSWLRLRLAGLPLL